MAETLYKAALSGAIHVRVTENVSLENLHSVVGRIVNLTGCPQCGLLGIDLRLTGDPADAHQIEKAAGVKSVTFGA
jgi:hypothetical protein